MDKAELKKLIEIAAGRLPADISIKNCKVIDVYNAEIIDGDIALCGGLIAGIGKYKGLVEIDAQGLYASPGFIDSHIHVESSYLSPEELGRLLVPCGTTTIISDPHEMVNVLGVKGLDYMIEASKQTALDIKWMLPSCVPATPFEHSGAYIDAKAMAEPITREKIIGLGEFMDYPGVINADEGVLDKIITAKKQAKLIDGHVPEISGLGLNAYSSTGIRTDHECSSVKEMHDRISRGMYVLLRQGSACHDLKQLLKGLTPQNSRRCLLCTDDYQPKSILSLGHLDNHLRICVDEGVNPLTAIQMASLNAAECYKLEDRGAIAPGLRADIVLFDSIKDFIIKRVFIEGREVAANGKYLLPTSRYDFSSTTGSFRVKDFSVDKLRLKLKSDKVNVIKAIPGGVVTAKETVKVKRDANGEFLYDPEQDIAKIAVIERHQNTGNVAVALFKDYGIKAGALAVSVVHDSHNIIVTGVNDRDMALAVEDLIVQGGGMILVKDGEIIESMPLPIAGLLSDQSGEWVDNKLRQIHKAAHGALGIRRDIEPVMTLCFMALPVIPEIKLTDMGLFDVNKFEFIPIEAEI